MSGVWAAVVALALLLAAGAYCSTAEGNHKREMCKEIMEHGTPEAKTQAVATFGACHP